ncbi:hypothetical protein ZIOFF_062498 [Zingiber officinale]|uniref:Uncharacterized protein n=1 Tax=Zingiber officinale TaxID=94328 RepID=A0A8J5F0W7_ZINOF|nr:hypothetical protein ZIOFF_062498 [Zingiber officinale]
MESHVKEPSSENATQLKSFYALRQSPMAMYVNWPPTTIHQAKLSYTVASERLWPKWPTRSQIMSSSAYSFGYRK